MLNKRMLKSVVYFVAAVVVLSALIWVAKHVPGSRRELVQSRIPKYINDRTSNESSNQVNGSPESAPESARHAGQAVQKNASLKELRDAIRVQEERVEERRKILSAIVRTKGVVYMDSDGNKMPQTNDGVPSFSSKEKMQQYFETERATVQLNSQLECLQMYEGEQLMVYASSLDLSENGVRSIYPIYLDAKRNLAELTQRGFQDSSPEVTAMVKEVEGLRKQVDEGVVNLKSLLQVQQALAAQRLVKASEARESAINMAGRDSLNYTDAKRDFEADQKLLQDLRLKLGRK